MHYWAAAKEAAETATEERPPGPLGDLLDAAAAAHPGLERVLTVSSVLVNGMAATRETFVPPGGVIEVLPPFAGG